MYSLAVEGWVEREKERTKCGYPADICHGPAATDLRKELNN